MVQSDFFESLDNARDIFKQMEIQDQHGADTFWDNLSYDDKCNAFHAVVQRIFEGEIKVQGSYRYVLYDIFGFGPDMYARGMSCGYMALHNSIMDEEEMTKQYMSELGVSSFDEKDLDN